MTRYLLSDESRTIQAQAGDGLLIATGSTGQCKKTACRRQSTSVNAIQCHHTWASEPTTESRRPDTHSRELRPSCEP